jgi:uncharacterized protein YwqG
MARRRKKAETKRQCSRLQLGGFRPTLNPLATNFALAPAARPGELWPHDGEGRPMRYICQLNLREAPFVPEALADVALLTFFVADSDRFIASGCAPETWCLRAYDTLDDLAALARPAIAEPEKLKREQRPRGFEGRWFAATDQPLYDDPEGDEDGESEPDHVYATKLGGYPSNLQHAVDWTGDDIAFALQIDSEAKVGLNWADRGIVYVGRGRTDRALWSVSCQFY